jgi:hypothetical protein
LQLNSEQITYTMERLHTRIGQRLPEAGILEVAKNLVDLCRHSSDRTRQIARPIFWVRSLVIVFLVLLLGFIVLIFVQVEMPEGRLELFNILQAFESGINDIVFTGIAIFFLVTLENRIKRGRAVRALHELRSIAHVIDMYQLTKDPDRTAGRIELTEASPRLDLSPIQVRRYLDYCSEMLSIVAKIAALYGQNLSDQTVVDSVKDVETLCMLLSNKIWQKLSIINANL